jgi:hypothetical protein
MFCGSGMFYLGSRIPIRPFLIPDQDPNIFFIPDPTWKEECKLAINMTFQCCNLWTLVHRYRYCTVYVRTTKVKNCIRLHIVIILSLIERLKYILLLLLNFFLLCFLCFRSKVLAIVRKIRVSRTGIRRKFIPDPQNWLVHWYTIIPCLLLPGPSDTTAESWSRDNRCQK